MDCIFCKIVEGSIPSDRVYEDEHVLAFRDIQPQAPTHVLVIPRVHVASMWELEDRAADLQGTVADLEMANGELEGQIESQPGSP